MKKVLFVILISIIVITGCEKKEITIDELNIINEKIINYFQSNNMYENYSYNYVDEEKKVVVVGLVNNTNEEQEWFIKNIVNSKYIKFEQGNHLYNEYEDVSILNSNKVDVNILVKFNDILFAKSNSIIDYSGNSNSVGFIDKLIPNKYIPKLNGETNTKDILSALVFDFKENSIVLFYNNEYVLFEKV